MHISIVIPVLNEQDSIIDLLTSLEHQTLQPSEVLIVDGGSTDKTIAKLQEFGVDVSPLGRERLREQGKRGQSKKSELFEIKVIHAPGSNRAQARNIGIDHAKSEIIAVTDAGCIAKKDWLEKLSVPFKVHSADVVAGFYDPDPKNWWEDMLADFTCVRSWNFDEIIFLPSSRSLAFTKDLWKKVGGYPEELETCEDLIFAERLKSHAKHWLVQKEAQVIWNQPKTLAQLTNKMNAYALGDLKAKYNRHTAKIHKAKWRLIALVGFAFPLLYARNMYVRMLGGSFFILYILGVWGKHFRMLKYPLAWFALPVVQLFVDYALVQALLLHHIAPRDK